MNGLGRVLMGSLRLALPYFRSEDRLAGGVLLASVIATELLIVGINVLINQWQARFFNAVQDRNWDNFVSELTYFCVLAGMFVALAVYQVYLNQWLQIRWRRWLTQVYLGHWLEGANHYRMQLLGDAADNPDQRIADDIKLYVEKILEIGIGLLSSIVTLLSFIAILWGLSAAAPLILFGVDVAIPGYLVWAALLYAVVGTALAHLIGWPLAGLNFRQQQYEADFRFNLVRARENSEQIALLEGERAETSRLLDRFRHVVDNFMLIMSRQKRLTFFTTSYSQAAVVFPYVLVSPAYFAGAFQLGGLMQTASAFDSVQRALSFFVTTYRQIAEFAAVVERLSGFDAAIAQARKLEKNSAIVTEPATGKGVAIDDLALELPNGTPLLAPADAQLPTGEHVLLTGPSGSGKSTLFRAIAGIWPFGRGRVAIPKDARIMMLPQRPYFPVASLGGAVTYPAEKGTFDDKQLAEVIAAVGLPELAGRLHEDGHWNRTLSLGEQQRLGIARAILQAPDFLFLDEATASLDEASEAALYALLHRRLPRTTVISIGHRSTLVPLHRRRLTLVRDGDRHKLSESKLESAAE